MRMLIQSIIFHPPNLVNLYPIVYFHFPLELIVLLYYLYDHIVYINLYKNLFDILKNLLC